MENVVKLVKLLMVAALVIYSLVASLAFIETKSDYEKAEEDLTEMTAYAEFLEEKLEKIGIQPVE